MPEVAGRHTHLRRMHLGRKVTFPEARDFLGSTFFVACRFLPVDLVNRGLIGAPGGIKREETRTTTAVRVALARQPIPALRATTTTTTAAASHSRFRTRATRRLETTATYSASTTPAIRQGRRGIQRWRSSSSRPNNGSWARI